MTIETKIAKNGAKLYYYEGKRISRDKALEIAANLRGDNLFTIEPESKVNVYGVTRGVKSGVTTITSKHEFKAVYMQTTYNGTMLWVSNSPGNYDEKVFAGSKDAVKKVAAAIDDAYFSGARGVKITASGEVEILPELNDITAEEITDATEAQDTAFNDAVDELKAFRADEVLPFAERFLKLRFALIASGKFNLNAFQRRLSPQYYCPAIIEEKELEETLSTICKKIESTGTFEQREAVKPILDECSNYTSYAPSYLFNIADEIVDQIQTKLGDKALADELKRIADEIGIDSGWLTISTDLNFDPSIFSNDAVVFTEAGYKHRIVTIGDETIHYCNGKFQSIWNRKYHAGIISGDTYLVEMPDGHYKHLPRLIDTEEFLAIMTERGACFKTIEDETEARVLYQLLEQHYRNYRQYRWKADILNDFMDAYCTLESPVSSSDEFEIRRLFNKIAAWRTKAKDKFEALADEMIILAEKYKDVEPFWSRYKEIQHYIAVQEGFIDEEVEDIA